MTRFRIQTLCMCLLLASHPLLAADDTPASQPSPKVAPLLLAAISAIGKATLDTAVDQGLFSRLYRSIFGSPDKKEAAASAPPATTASSPAGLPSPSSIVPAVGYTIEQLDPASFKMIKVHPLDSGIPTMKTGDVFAMHYSTNLPGLVRLENIDSTGQVSNLGVYTVLPDQDNRIPENRGIALTGTPGNEIIKVYFYPCIPLALAGKPTEATLRGKIPSCEANAGNQMNAAAKGSLRTKALVNLAQPNPTMVFSGTNDYQANDVTSTVVVLRHEPATK